MDFLSWAYTGIGPSDITERQREKSL